MIVNAYLNEWNNNWDKMKKRLQMASTLPAAICERLQLLPTYFE